MSTKDSPADSTPPKTAKGLAEFYHTNERNIFRYQAKGAPMANPVEFRAWLETQKSAPEVLMKRLDELCGDQRADSVEEAAKDWAEFERQAKTENPDDVMAKISKVRDWAFDQFEKAAKKKDKKNEKFYSDLLAKMEGTLHDAQIRAKKLGLDAGDLMPRSTLEAHARWMVYHLLRCSDAAMADIISGLSRAGCNLSVQQIQRVIEPVLSTADYLEPYLRAGEGDNDAAPPDWLMAALKAGAADVLENEI